MNLEKLFEAYKKTEDIDTIQISYCVIDYCQKKGINLTNLKLLKLLYFIDIQYMKHSKGKPIFKEEFLAWRHGPVLQSVYDHFKYGIKIPSFTKVQEIKIKLGKEKTDIIDDVLKNKAIKNVWDLVEETHDKKGPWFTVFNNSKTEDNMCFKPISHSLIYEYYKNK